MTIDYRQTNAMEYHGGMRYLLLIGVLSSMVVACGGQLFIPESDISRREDPTHKPCTLVNPEGRCPDGLECCSGVCAASCEAWMCNCDPQQACVSGECTDITGENCCSSERPEGLCPMGQVCLGGTCVPLSGVCGCEDGWACVNGECVEIKPGEECTTDRPTGLCPDGQVCIGGECLPINNLCSQANCNGLCPLGSTCSGCRCVPIDRPCGLNEPDGQCPSCYTCEPPGECVIVECSPEAPHCACLNADEYCDNGECKAFPCSPGYTEGECPDDEVCCSEGRCVAEGGCCADADCQGNTKCSKCEPMCINLDSCLCNDDCEPHYTCESQGCVRDLSCPNGDTDCIDGEICDSTHQCRPEGTCGVNTDCRDADKYCSMGGTCLPIGYCDEDDDCAEAEVDKCSSVDTCYCASDHTCLEPPACAGNVDCAPGYMCDGDPLQCVPGGVECTANGGASCVSAGGETFWCCPTGETCCEQGQRCSDETHTCIVDGQCAGDGDCLTPYFTCDTDSNTCVPVTACSGNTCGSGQTCSQAGGCIPNDGTCVADGDCEDGEVCNALFECEPRVGCGSQDFEATLVPPNMLIVLDRSGSMDWCIDGSHSGCNASNPQRWDTAVDAIGQVTLEHSDKIRFGLCTYPGAGGSRAPGDINVSIGEDTRTTIMTTYLCGNACSGGPPCACPGGSIYPNGATPTGPTLRSTIYADPGAAGLTDQERDNYVLLITDGDANSDYNDNVPACSAVCDSDPCDSGSATNACCECRVNNALDGLVSLTIPISSFIVGFGAGIAHPEYVNCFAVHGGASRCATPVECQAISDPSTCTDTHACSWSGSCDGGRDSANCHDTSVECYYKADDAQALSDAFADIAGQIASCTYSLDQIPEEPDNLFVYFYYGCANITDDDQCTITPGCGWESDECVGEPMWLERDDAHIDNWDYDQQNNRILFFGSACQEVKAGLVTPVVIMGCCEGGEC